MKSVVVYCGSSHGNKAGYAETAYRLGEVLAQRKIRTIYGGGNMGLMGKVADGVLDSGGAVTGIIPNFLAKLEQAQKTVTELHFVETMHERKAKMVSLSDGVVALPGGYGTLDELFEILTWSQLGIYKGPVGLLNVEGYYDHLLAHVNKMVDEGFLKIGDRDRLIVEQMPELLLERMNLYYLENSSPDHSL